MTHDSTSDLPPLFHDGTPAGDPACAPPSDGAEAGSLPPGPTPPKSFWRKGLMFVGLILISLVAAVVFAGALVFAPIGPKVAPLSLVIAKGTSVQGIASLLETKDIVPVPLFFRVASRVLANDKLHACEYQFLPTQNLVDIVMMMRDGVCVIRRFTVPEGLTSQEIVTMLNDDPALSGEITDVPPEGALLPETYHYTYGDARAEILERMHTARDELLQNLWAHRAPDVSLSSPEQALVMASLIEKETGKKADERARVAGVFYNRLKIGMRLQSDPTVIYALTNGKGPLNRELSHQDLGVDSPYNTYVKEGMPPKPICNPGRASLLAAMHPEKNDFLYFVADGSGGHAFAKDLAAHNRNVSRWHSLSHP